MGKEVIVLPGAVTSRSRHITIELVVFVFGSVGSLVGTLSGHCLGRQLALHFVFGSMWVLGQYLEWALSSPPGCDYSPTVCDLRAFEFSRMSGPWSVP